MKDRTPDDDEVLAKLVAQAFYASQPSVLRFLAEPVVA
jgi:hypothetical protein